MALSDELERLNRARASALLRVSEDEASDSGSFVMGFIIGLTIGRDWPDQAASLLRAVVDFSAVDEDGRAKFERLHSLAEGIARAGENDGRARDVGWDWAADGDICQGCGSALTACEPVYIGHKGQRFCRDCKLAEGK